MLSKFGSVKNLATDYIFSLASIRAGIPTLLIAPPSGGKTTIVYALEKYLKRKNENVMLISRLGLRGLKNLAKVLNYSKEFTLLNEDYALIGSSDYMAEKLAEIVGALSYSKTYYDYGLDVKISLNKLGFISGVQPFWLKKMITKPAYITHIREKFIRYYMLPYTSSGDVEMLDAIMTLVDVMEEIENKAKKRGNYKIPKDFIISLANQVGIVRAKEYTWRLAEALKELIGSRNVNRALKFYSKRIGFEEKIVRRELGENGYSVDVLWREYTALYWALRRGKITREEMRLALGVSSMRSVERVVSSGLAVRFITTQYNSSRLYIIPNPYLKEELKW